MVKGLQRERERKVLDDYKYDNGFVVLFFFVIPTFLTYDTPCAYIKHSTKSTKS